MSAEINRETLAKILGRMGSAFDGEILTAAKTAARLVRAAGATWEDIIVMPTVTAAPQLARPEPPQPWDSAEDCKGAVDALLLWPQHLSPWERRFLVSLQQRNRRLTPKQYRCLEKIGTRVDRVIRVSWEVGA